MSVLLGTLHDAPTPRRRSLRSRAGDLLPRLVLSPSLAIVLVFVYGFIIWTAYISMSASKVMPNYQFVGLDQYFRLWASANWHMALRNLAIFGTLYIGVAMALGLLLAIFLDQKIRIEGFLRPVYLYPMALSFIVTGTAWKWFLNPGYGLQHTMRELGWTGFAFDWLSDPRMAIYCVVIAGVWQVSGFVMALFLAGLRGIDSEIFRAAQMDGATPFNLYRRVVLPQLKPVFFATFVVLAHMAIKSYDLVIALTNAGPGNATELPSTFMTSYTFQRSQLAVGAASAVMMFMIVCAVIVPYLYSELRERPAR